MGAVAGDGSPHEVARDPFEKITDEFDAVQLECDEIAKRQEGTNNPIVKFICGLKLSTRRARLQHLEEDADIYELRHPGAN